MHEMNGLRATVKKGDLLFIAPHHIEHCYTEADENLSLLQILFRQDSFSFITERYSKSVGMFFQDDARNPFHHCNPIQQNWIKRNYNQLMVNRGDLIDFECFLLNIFNIIRQSSRSIHGDPAKPWINHALEGIQEPENFRKGVQGFVELCRRSQEHVEREVRKHTGQTTSYIVNQARMAWASYMLLFSDMEILDISQGCGLESVSYFYKVFRKSFAISPGQYRRLMRHYTAIEEQDAINTWRFNYLY